MRTFLFLWNPKKWNWHSLESDIRLVDSTGHCNIRWSTGKNKSIKLGDRIFLLKVGTKPKGIIAAGFVSSEIYEEIHWKDKNKTALYVNVDFEVLLNPSIDSILSTEVLGIGKLANQNWQPMSSGITIKEDLADELELLWFEFLIQGQFRNNPFVPLSNNDSKKYTEGTPQQISITKYERNPYARKKCLEYYGYICVVCGFDFEKKYGSIAKNYIHVHHLKQISILGQLHQVDPIKDLRPVCPNCHSIIHINQIPLTLEEIMEFIYQNSNTTNVIK